MSLKDELHDVKVLGGVRNYLLTVWQIKRGNWDWHRAAREKARAERKERRLMKTSTYDALMENIGEYADADAQVIHEDLLHDTIAVERRRWLERAAWLALVCFVAAAGALAGWYMQPQFKPEPWVCDVKVVPDAPLVEPTIMRCVGGGKPE